MSGYRQSGGGGGIVAALLALVPGSIAADWEEVTSARGVWRKLAHIGAGATPLDLTTGGDTTYVVTDSDGRSTTLLSEGTATVNTMEVVDGGIHVNRTSSGASAVLLELASLTGWDPRKRTYIAVHLDSPTMPQNSDRLHLQVVNHATTWTRQMVTAFKRFGAADYGANCYYWNGSIWDIDEFTGLVATPVGDHWLVLELSPGCVRERSDFGVTAPLPDLPEDTTFRAETTLGGNVHLTAEQTQATWATHARIAFQAGGAVELDAVMELYVLQEGA